MDLFEHAARLTHPLLPASTLDRLLTAQLAVSWAGEGGERPRLGWWRCDLFAEDGGLALFEDLLPRTARWAALEATREAARRADRALRYETATPDEVISLYRFGAEIDTRLAERLGDLKAGGRSPEETLPVLGALIGPGWNRDTFLDWIADHGEPAFTHVPLGRRVKGDPHADPEQLMRRFVAALAPLGDRYPLPHVRRMA